MSLRVEKMRDRDQMAACQWGKSGCASTEGIICKSVRGRRWKLEETLDAVMAFILKDLQLQE